MPGNIRVAVLEAVDLPAAVTAGKSVAVKVAVGKKEFQTTPVDAEDGRTQPWNSEFLFPVLNLRDNLIVGILDDKGDVVARAEIETPGIVQKGFQDEFIALKAGGRIHMKVSFVLSEEERKKIDAMRLAAMRKRKGFNLPHRSRQAPVSNVKITEITSEDTETTPEPKDSNDVHIKRSPPREKKLGSLPETQRGVPEQSQTTRKLVPDEKPSIPLKVERSRGVSTQKPRTMQPPVIANVPEAADAEADGNLTPEDLTSSKRKGFKWLTGKLHGNQSKAQGGRWLEDMKLKSTDQLRAAKAAKADEWIKTLDRRADEIPSSTLPQQQKPLAADAKFKQEGMRLTKHLHEEQRKLAAMNQKNLRKQNETATLQHKSVQETLEDWKVKELGPWRRGSKVRHASPPDLERNGTRWKLISRRKGGKGRKNPGEAAAAAGEYEFDAEADKLWASSQLQDGSCSPDSSQKKSSSGMKSLMKQVLSGAAVVAGSFILWSRKGPSKKKERFHIVKEGETLSSIVPNEYDDPDSEFYRLNPDVVDKHTIYPGQSLRLPA